MWRSEYAKSIEILKSGIRESKDCHQSSSKLKIWVEATIGKVASGSSKEGQEEMLVQNAEYQSNGQVGLMAERSYASRARKFMERIKIPEFPSAAWAGTHVLPGSSHYQPIRMAKIEPLKMSAFVSFNHVDISA